MGDFFEARFSRASPEERKKKIIQYFGDVAGCSGDMMAAWEKVWLSNDTNGEKLLVDAIDSAPLTPQETSLSSGRDDDGSEAFVTPLQSCIFDYASRDDLLTRLGLDAAVLAIVSVRISWSMEQTLVAARESSGVLFTAMIGRCSCPDSAMCAYPSAPCTHVTCSPKLVKQDIFLDWEFPPLRLQEVCSIPARLLTLLVEKWDEECDIRHILRAFYFACRL